PVAGHGMPVRPEYSLAPPFIETRPENRRWSGHTCDHGFRRAYPLLRDRLARPLTLFPSELSTLNSQLLRSSALDVGDNASPARTVGCFLVITNHGSPLGCSLPFALCHWTLGFAASHLPLVTRRACIQRPQAG